MARTNPHIPTKQKPSFRERESDRTRNGDGLDALLRRISRDRHREIAQSQLGISQGWQHQFVSHDISKDGHGIRNGVNRLVLSLTHARANIDTDAQFGN